MVALVIPKRSKEFQKVTCISFSRNKGPSVSTVLIAFALGLGFLPGLFLRLSLGNSAILLIYATEVTYASASCAPHTPHAPKFIMIKLSVLDQSPIRSGSHAGEALNETVALAQLCEELGYYRYWVAEHHASDALAGCSPEVLLGRLGAETSRIRIGSGGVMLPHYSPYKVAENFKLLQAMYPGRIDLGVGRAPGTDPFTAAALRYGSRIGPQHFPQMVADLQALLNDTDPSTPGMEAARAFPIVESPPQMWMLGSSEDSADFAATAGLPYSFAYFINPGIRRDIFELYRSRFKPGPNQQQPHTSLCIFTICAATEEEAIRLSRSRDLWFIRLLQGAPGPVPTIEEAMEYPYSDGELRAIEANRDKRAVGTPAQVKQKLLSVVDEFNVDELMILTITHDPKARQQSYRLLAGEWGLPDLPASGI